MDVNGISSAATALSAANTQREVSTAVLKKAIDLGAEGAISLIEAIPDNASSQNLPSNLGRNVNTTA